jgi:transposase-like protein
MTTANKTLKRTGARIIKKMPTAKDRNKTPRLWNDASVLRRLYVDDGKSQSEIARELGCSLVTVNKAFKKAGIKARRGRRPLSPGAKKARTAVVRRSASYGSIVTVRRRINELVDILPKLGPKASAAVKQDLHDLVDQLQ